MRSINFILYFLLATATTTLGAEICGQEISSLPAKKDGVTIPVAKLTSIVSCTIQNLRGLNSGDVLITKESLFDNVEDGEAGPSGIIGRNHFVVRVCFDVTAGRYAYYGLQKQDVTRLPSNQQHPKMRYTAFCYGGDDEPVFTWFSDRLGIKSMASYGNSIMQLHKTCGFLDPRSLPLYGALGPLPIELDGETKPRSGELAKNVTFSSQIDDKIIIKYRFENSGMDGFETIVSEHYHLSSLMLVSKAVSFRNVDSKKDSPYRSFRTKWKEYDGVQVPTSLSIEQKAIIEVAGKKERGIEESTFKLDWLSVNKPIDDSNFDGSSMHSTELIRKMIDVENLGNVPSKVSK